LQSIFDDQISYKTSYCEWILKMIYLKIRVKFN
jgi:hypothetical protein